MSGLRKEIKRVRPLCVCVCVCLPLDLLLPDLTNLSATNQRTKEQTNKQTNQKAKDED